MVLTRSVPDWLIVIVLFLMMAFLAIKVLAKGRQMYKAETSQHEAHAEAAEQTAEAQPPQNPPAATEGPRSPPAGPPESPPPRLEPDKVQPLRFLLLPSFLVQGRSSLPSMLQEIYLPPVKPLLGCQAQLQVIRKSKG